MNSITQNHQDEELLSKKMQVFFRRYQVSRILRAANAYKLRGVPVLSIFLLVFRMVLQQRSVYTQMHLQSTAMPFGKDTFYRFTNSCRIHWRRFTTVDELPDVCFVEAIVERLQEKPMLDEGEIQGQLKGFLKELPVLLSQKLRKCA